MENFKGSGFKGSVPSEDGRLQRMETSKLLKTFQRLNTFIAWITNQSNNTH
ncbi:hypothetical protein A2U01_0113727, partial [Trifolium medium]|nr:hypothetical protein [Trifolium medium]